ncbi:hypothetical protein K1T71_004940 [Dendrolimus kikuchii]|uniref:Uncharacterized protein n=1 Tax=Dendrolimus kikuchii TaxID=765133 RepID=A0ACC1D5M3_9NEOP|nr:hypothetical protein K1T71_004940 [Dendrolimus kikuchii]
MTQVTNTNQVYENQAYLPEQPPAYEDVCSETQNISPTVQQPVGPKPFFRICPSCHHEVLTKIETKITIMTHLLALTLCLLECYICACLPYCMDSFKNKDHRCPHCSTFLGTYKN